MKCSESLNDIIYEMSKRTLQHRHIPYFIRPHYNPALSKQASQFDDPCVCTHNRQHTPALKFAELLDVFLHSIVQFYLKGVYNR